MKLNRVPFYSNTPDETHCFQAAIKSVLKYFLPNQDFSWKQLEKMSAKRQGLWTSATGMLITLSKMGFDLIDIDNYDIERYLKEGGKYLIAEYGKEVGEAQIKHSDIDHEKRLYKKYLPLNIHQFRSTTLDEIRRFIDQGYLVICLVNSHALNNMAGYAGHFVLIFGYDNRNFYLHDPGLPPKPDRRVSFKQFLKAWEYPSEKARNLTAYRFPQTKS